MPCDQGYDCVYTLAHKALALSSRLVNRTMMEDAYRLVAKEWTIDLGQTPTRSRKPYIALHLRGDDKRGDFRSLKENFKTHDFLARLPDGVDVIAITDDSELAALYLRDYPSFSIERSEFEPREKNDLHGLAVLMDAKAIIQHAENGWSAYSSVVAMAKGIPLINTYVGPSLNRLNLFERMGGCPKELAAYTSEAANDFLHHLSFKKIGIS